MSIKVFRNMLSLNAQRFLAPNTAIKKSVGQITNDIRINRSSDDAVDFKVSGELRSDNRIINIAMENLSAADSTIRETGIAKEIAILTRNHILGTASVTMEEQTDLRTKHQPNI